MLQCVRVWVHMNINQVMRHLALLRRELSEPTIANTSLDKGERKGARSTLSDNNVQMQALYAPPVSSSFYITYIHICSRNSVNGSSTVG